MDTHRRLHLTVQAVTNGVDSKSQVLLLPQYRIGRRRRQPIVVVSALPALEEFALLACTDAQHDSEMVSKVVSELGLTSAEQRLACQLVVGDCLEDAAEHLNIRVSTARSYLRSIFGKTGTSRQTELVAMVLSLALPISSADLKVVDCSAAFETALEHGGHRFP